MTELERLQKAVVDTEAAYYDADAALYAAEDAQARARLELGDYLKEQDNE